MVILEHQPESWRGPYMPKQLAESAEDIIRLAEPEGLDANARSVRVRQQG